MEYTDWKDVPLILDVDETAELLRVHRNTVIAMIKDGRLSAKKLGRVWRIKKDDVRAYLNGSDKGEQS